MSSIPTVTSVVTQSWFKVHERLLIVLMVLLAGSWGYSKYADALASKAETKATTAQAVLVQQIQTNTQLAQQTAQQTAQYQQMVQTLTAQNAALLAAIQSDNVILKQQQTKDKTMTPTQLTQRWAQLVPGVAPSASSDGVVLSTGDAQSTVVQLEEVTVLTQDLKSETEIAQNFQNELNAAVTVNQDQAKQITGLKMQLTEQVKADQAEITEIKAKSRRSKLRWFIAGLVAGFVGRGSL